MNTEITKSQVLEAIKNKEISKGFAKILFPNYFGTYSRRVLYINGTKSTEKLDKAIIGVEWCPLNDGKSLWVNLIDLAVGEHWHKAKDVVESLDPTLGINWRLATPGELRHGFDEVEAIDDVLKEFNGADLIDNDNRCWIWGTEYSDKGAWTLYTERGIINNYAKGNYDEYYRVRAFLAY
jgi:hypothetical protein